MLKKLQLALPAIGAVVAILDLFGSDTMPGAEKKAAALAALNKLEGEFKTDIPDKWESLAIDLLCFLRPFLLGAPPAQK